MADPPDLWGWAPRRMTVMDWRWDAVKDAPAPGDAALRAGGTDARATDMLVNNRINYVWEFVDIWSPPQFTLARGFGDCEDFAILKRSLLLAAGMPESRIYYLLVLDVLARCDHAVLLVEDNGWRILDCRRSLAGGALPVDQVMDFTPKRAMQGSRQWDFERRRPPIV